MVVFQGVPSVGVAAASEMRAGRCSCPLASSPSSSSLPSCFFRSSIVARVAVGGVLTVWSSDMLLPQPLVLWRGALPLLTHRWLGDNPNLLRLSSRVLLLLLHLVVSTIVPMIMPLLVLPVRVMQGNGSGRRGRIAVAVLVAMRNYGAVMIPGVIVLPARYSGMLPPQISWDTGWWLRWNVGGHPAKPATMSPRSSRRRGLFFQLRAPHALLPPR